MAKALIIFASESDQAVFKPLIDGLKKENIPYEFHICSVHRNPEGLDPLLKGDYSYVISGAGLSAALPGSIASKITKPVFGIPCKGNYEGLDAMLSIMQMPPGIPVLGVGVNRFESILSAAKKLQKPFFEINLVSESHSRAMEKAEAVLREFEIIFKKSDAIEQNAINIEFVQLDEDIPEKDALVIYCPLLLEEDDRAEAAL
ncbi:AIR carboxylase family protein, partial [Candidatus Woesearchaeota archaeon]|nr:AIR carboxylase family protein [Candidatus Woesearchaeota archaeon]